MVEPDHVAGIEREARRRQPERGGLAADPFLEQRPPAAALGVAGGRRDRKGLGGDPQRRAGRAPRLDAHRVILLVGAHQLPLQRLRQLGLLRPHQLDDLGVGVGARHKVVEGERRHRPPVARLEADDALALDRVEAEMPRQGRDRGARAFECSDQVSMHHVGEGRDVDLAVGQPGAAAEVAHQRARARPIRAGRSANGRAASCRRRSRRRSAPGTPGTAARPRSRPRSRRGDHPPGIDADDRVVRGSTQ